MKIKDIREKLINYQSKSPFSVHDFIILDILNKLEEIELRLSKLEEKSNKTEEIPIQKGWN